MKAQRCFLFIIRDSITYSLFGCQRMVYYLDNVLVVVTVITREYVDVEGLEGTFLLINSSLDGGFNSDV